MGSIFPHGRSEPAVAMKVNCDLQLTLMASSLYRLGTQIGATATRWRSPAPCSATSSTLPRWEGHDRQADDRREILRGAHNPLLIAAGLIRPTLRSPGWGESSASSFWPVLHSAPTERKVETNNRTLILLRSKNLLVSFATLGIQARAARQRDAEMQM